MRLANWLENERITQSDFAARIGTSQAAVARYANGVRLPRRQHMEAIARETGGRVTASDFYAATPIIPEPEAVPI